MHTVFALLCFVVVIHWLIFPYPSGLLHWHCGNLTIAPVPAKQPWWIWINTSCEFIINDCITTTKQSTTKPCAYFLGYTVFYVLYCDGTGVFRPQSGLAQRQYRCLDVEPTGSLDQPVLLSDTGHALHWSGPFSWATLHRLTARLVVGYLIDVIG